MAWQLWILSHVVTGYHLSPHIHPLSFRSDGSWNAVARTEWEVKRLLGFPATRNDSGRGSIK